MRTYRKMSFRSLCYAGGFHPLIIPPQLSCVLPIGSPQGITAASANSNEPGAVAWAVKSVGLPHYLLTACSHPTVSKQIRWFLRCGLRKEATLREARGKDWYNVVLLEQRKWPAITRSAHAQPTTELTSILTDLFRLWARRHILPVFRRALGKKHTTAAHRLMSGLYLFIHFLFATILFAIIRISISQGSSVGVWPHTESG